MTSSSGHDVHTFDSATGSAAHPETGPAIAGRAAANLDTCQFGCWMATTFCRTPQACQGESAETWVLRWIGADPRGGHGLL